MLSWDGTSYNPDLLIDIRDDFKEFLTKLNLDKENTNDKVIKNDFSLLLSNKPEFKTKKMYKKPEDDPDCEIKSTVENFLEVLSYIFKKDLSKPDKNSDIKSLITENKKIDSIIYKPSLDFANIEIVSEKIKIIFNINKGHSKFKNVSLNEIWSKQITDFNYFDYFILLNDKIEYYPEDWEYYIYYNFKKYYLDIPIDDIPFVYINFLSRESIWKTFYFDYLDIKYVFKTLQIVEINKNKDYIKNILNIGKEMFLLDEHILTTIPYYIKYKPDLLSKDIQEKYPDLFKKI
jgi:hypothetical protein